MLWKAKLCAFLVALAFCGVTFAIVYSLPAVYRAEALILVDSQKIPEKYVSSTVNDELQDRLATISQQILSSTRLQRIIDSFSLYREERKRLSPEEIIEKMRKDVNITLEKGWTRNRPGAFRIAYESPVPATTAEVANQIGNLFIEENLRARETHAEGTSDFIEVQLGQAKKKLDELEAEVSKFKLLHTGELPQQENALIGVLARLQVELQGNQDAVNRAQQAKMMAEGSLAVASASLAALTRPPDPPPRRLPEASGTATDKKDDAPDPEKTQDSKALETRLELLKLRYNDQHPEVRRLRELLAQVREMEKSGAIEKMRAAAPKTFTPAGAPAAIAETRRDETEIRQQNERIANMQTQIDMAKREVEMRNAERKEILNKIVGYQARVDKLPVREQEMASLTRDYEIAKTNYRSLLDKKLSAEMSTDMERRQQSERFTMIDSARTPGKPIRPNRPLFAGIGAALSLALGLAAAVGKEIRKNVLLGEWELPADIAVLARVPRIGKSRRRRPASKWKLAFVSAGLLLLLGATAAAVYLGWSRWF
jgi:polysaccharide chain length determinant protein (PEP-CTERM system associated)